MVALGIHNNLPIETKQYKTIVNELIALKRSSHSSKMFNHQLNTKGSLSRSALLKVLANIYFSHQYEHLAAQYHDVAAYLAELN